MADVPVISPLLRLLRRRSVDGLRLDMPIEVSSSACLSVTEEQLVIDYLARSRGVSLLGSHVSTRLHTLYRTAARHNTAPFAQISLPSLRL